MGLKGGANGTLGRRDFLRLLSRFVLSHRFVCPRFIHPTVFKILIRNQAAPKIWGFTICMDLRRAMAVQMFVSIMFHILPSSQGSVHLELTLRNSQSERTPYRLIRASWRIDQLTDRHWKSEKFPRLRDQYILLRLNLEKPFAL